MNGYSQKVERAEKFVGWNPQMVAPAQRVGDYRSTETGGVLLGAAEPTTMTHALKFNPDRPFETLRVQTIALIDKSHTQVSNITLAPHYRMLLNYLRADDGGRYSRTPPPLPSGSALADQAKKNVKLGAFTGIRRNGCEIVGRSNIGEVKFTPLVVSYRVHWEEESSTTIEWVRFDVSLDLNDGRYPRFSYPGQP